MLATILAIRTSAQGSNEEILDHLRQIQHVLDEQISKEAGEVDSRGMEDEADELDGENNEDNEKHVSQFHGAIQALTDVLKNRKITTRRPLEGQMQICLERINKANLGEREQDILSWRDLWQTIWRYEDVCQAYRDTYEWTFTNADEDRYLDNFVAYLKERVQLPCFLEGKAGSGKSTLMKFIYSHSRTKSALQDWAGTNEIVVLHFFFWNLGTSLRKSHIEMLRALLHALLSQHPELISIALPTTH
jgi:hypothetical protein